MNASPSSRVDSIRRSFVSLKMPRVLEILDATLQRIEQGQIDGIEAIDDILGEEVSLRENRRIKAAPAHGASACGEDAGRLRLLVPAFARQEPHPGACRPRRHRAGRSR